MAAMTISNGLIKTVPAMQFPYKTITITSSGINGSTGSLNLNTEAKNVSISHQTIVATPVNFTLPYLTLSPSVKAPSKEAAGYMVEGAVIGVKPPSPTITNVTLGEVNGQVKIYFTMSDLNAGQPIESMTIVGTDVLFPDLVWTQVTTTNFTSPYVFSGLRLFKRLTFKIKASTASFPDGEWSASSNPITVDVVDPNN